MIANNQLKFFSAVIALTGLMLVAACSSSATETPTGEPVSSPAPSAAVNPPTETERPVTPNNRASSTADASSPVDLTLPELSISGPVTLAAGVFQLPAADDFGVLGFHEVLTASHDLPADLGSAAGSKLVLKLWDVRRPETSCNSNHPLSGCATVDWSDATGRPKVPTGGVFENSITFQGEEGAHSFFLSELGNLNDAPDLFKPG